MLNGNMLIAHGGGPTPVINSSLLGAVREAKRHPEIETIYGARIGAEGILAGDLMDLGRFSDDELGLLSRTPASALGSCRRKLTERGVEFEPDVPFGVMLSVPAACLTAEDFTAHGCRFFVIGTNDLTQYTHAVSRELAIAEHYYRPASPAMKKLIAMVVDAARKADIPVTICGLAVGNAVNATQYLHLGLRSFSMSPQNLLAIKKALRDADAE